MTQAKPTTNTTSSARIKSLRIGPFDFKVKYVKNVARSGGDKRYKGMNLMGMCDTMHTTLFIRKGMDEIMTLETILHEALHAIWMLTGNYLQESVEEEAAVTSITPYLLQLLRDNPRLKECI